MIRSAECHPESAATPSLIMRSYSIELSQLMPPNKPSVFIDTPSQCLSDSASARCSWCQQSPAIEVIVGGLDRYQRILTGLVNYLRPDRLAPPGRGKVAMAD